MESDGELSRWFALAVKPNHEHTVAAVLRTKGFDDFLPLYTSRRRWSDRVKVLQLPLFAGYVFCRFQLQSRMSVLSTPGVRGVVGIGKRPEPVEDSEIRALQQLARSGVGATPCSYFRIGETVRVIDGPLCGVEGILVDINQERQLVVSVTLLQRSVAVRLDPGWIEPINRRIFRTAGDRPASWPLHT